jgi:pimeloyl-ACP methyl ester carboxylesterase
MSPLPPPNRVQRAFDHARSLPGRALSRFLGARKGLRVRQKEVWLTNQSGYRVSACWHEPDDWELRPGVVLVPGAGRSGKRFCGMGALVGADELARMGFRVLHFSPIGRGDSWGHDDFCGLEGQDSFRAALDFVHTARGVDPERVAVVSFSLGLALALPVLAREGERLGTRLLIDWEGPSDRDGMLATGPLPPVAEAALRADSESFWLHREPLASISAISCQYLRLQGEVDHALGSVGREHALRLVQAAADGRAASSQLNTNPPVGSRIEREMQSFVWAPTDAGAVNRLLREQLKERLIL